MPLSKTREKRSENPGMLRIPVSRGHNLENVPTEPVNKYIPRVTRLIEANMYQYVRSFKGFFELNWSQSWVFRFFFVFTLLIYFIYVIFFPAQTGSCSNWTPQFPFQAISTVYFLPRQWRLYYLLFASHTYTSFGMYIVLLLVLSYLRQPPFKGMNGGGRKRWRSTSKLQAVLQGSSIHSSSCLGKSCVKTKRWKQKVWQEYRRYGVVEFFYSWSWMHTHKYMLI